MLRMILLALGLAALAILAACGGDKEPDVSDFDGQRVLAETRDAMAGLQSYHVDVRFGKEAELVSIDWAWRGGRRFFMDAHPEPVAEFLDESVVESISLAVLGPSPSRIPYWSIVALDKASGAQVVEVSESVGVETVHIRARVNHLRAILESYRQIISGVGMTTFGRSCEAEAGRAPRCEALSFEELLALQEPQLSFYDSNQAVIDVWIADDDLARRIKFTIPPYDDADKVTAVTFDFSRFDEVKPPGPPQLPPVP